MRSKGSWYSVYADNNRNIFYVFTYTSNINVLKKISVRTYKSLLNYFFKLYICFHNYYRRYVEGLLLYLLERPTLTCICCVWAVGSFTRTDLQLQRNSSILIQKTKKWGQWQLSFFVTIQASTNHRLDSKTNQREDKYM